MTSIPKWSRGCTFQQCGNLQHILGNFPTVSYSLNNLEMYSKLIDKIREIAQKTHVPHGIFTSTNYQRGIGDDWQVYNYETARVLISTNVHSERYNVDIREFRAGYLTFFGPIFTKLSTSSCLYDSFLRFASETVERTTSSTLFCWSEPASAMLD